MSNMKQLGLALMQYAQDYDETFVAQAEAVAPNWGWQETWMFTTQPYMKNYGIVRCPSDIFDDVPSWSGPEFSYVANGAIA